MDNKTVQPGCLKTKGFLNIVYGLLIILFLPVIGRSITMEYYFSVPGIYSDAMPVMAVAQGDILHVLFRDQTKGYRLMYISGPAPLPGGAFSGVATIVDVENTFGAADVVIDSSGSPHVAYYGTYNSSLKYARLVNGAWVVETVSSINQSVGEINPSIALDPLDRPHIAFLTNQGVSYTTRVNGQWMTEVVASNAKEPSICVDSRGIPVLSLTIGSFTQVVKRRIAGQWVTQFSGPKTASEITDMVLNGDGKAIVVSGVKDSGVAVFQETTTTWLNSGIGFAQHSGSVVYAFAGFDGNGFPIVRTESMQYVNSVPRILNKNYWAKGTTFLSGWTSFQFEKSWHSFDLLHGLKTGDLVFNGGTNWFLRSSGTPLGMSSLSPVIGGSGRDKTQAPTHLVASTITFNSVTWTWADNSVNETGFDIFGSTEPEGPYNLIAGNLPPGTTSYLESGFQSGDTVYRYVIAKNKGGFANTNVGKAVVLTPPGQPENPVGHSVSSTTIHWQWSPGQLAENHFVIDENAQRVSGYLGAQAGSWIESGLPPNRSFARRVVSVAGTRQNVSSVMSTSTFAAVPVGLRVTGNDVASVWLAWDLFPNPAGTNFELSHWKLGESSSTILCATTSWRVDGLEQNTTYYFSVKAIDLGLIRSDPSAVVSGFSLGLSSAVVNIFSGPISTHSIQWNWDDNNTGEVGYLVENALGENISGLLPPNSVSWLQGGMTPNSSSTVVIASLNSKANTRSHAVTAHSLANPPFTTRFTRVTSNSLDVEWTANGNPDGTRYRVEYSQNPNPFVSVIVHGTSTTISGLTPLGTYLVRVRAINEQGFETNADVTISTTTPLQPASPSDFRVVQRTTGTLSLTWTDNSLTETGYRIIRVLDQKNLSGDLPSNSIFYTLNVGSPNAAVNCFVAAFNMIGVGSSNQLTAFTSAMAPKDLRVTAQSDFAELAWSANQNPDGTTYVLSIKKQGVLVSTATTLSTQHKLVGLDTNSAYTVVVQAKNGDGILTDAEEPQSQASFSTGQSFMVEYGVDSSINFALSWGAGRVDIPAGSLRGAVAPLQVFEDGSTVRGAKLLDNARALGKGIQMVAGQNTGQLAKPVVLSVSYALLDLTGITPNRLSLAFFDPLSGKWVPQKTLIDTETKTLAARTLSLGRYAVLEVDPSEGVEDISVFPNPLRPGQGQITFGKLPANATLNVYTYSRRFVRTMMTDASGQATWDGTDDGGEPVPNGVYLVFIETGGQTKTLRVMVQR